MKKIDSRKKAVLAFLLVLLAAAVCFGASYINTKNYNSAYHTETFAGKALFAPETEPHEGVSVHALARSSTWGKIFDFNNEGITENNYQAYTYDFYVNNHTGDQVDEFKFKLTFSRNVFLSSAWNGALEIHQNVKGGEMVATIPDLREFKPDDYSLEIYRADGEAFVCMNAGDYLVYLPSSSANALEMPIEPKEGTAPGIIMYVAMDENIEDSSLELTYSFNRKLTSTALFWIAMGIAALWLVALVIFIITSIQIHKYKVRHERDNVIINESIETFTGFIDAKDPYTNGHSKRVALYTRLIAEELGFGGEELDHIYYIALLHDCGKIGVPDNILGKPGKLTDEEFEIIKSHTVRGGDILSSFKSLENAGEGALYHHERYDGKGYPEGRSGEDIPLIARMICVADSFDAMNTNRVYRGRLSRDRIINELETNKAKQFDPRIADIMLKLIEEGKVKTEE